MSKVRKTREEKIQSGYRLQNFKLSAASAQGGSAYGRKDVSEFSYLSSEYVVKDLRRTAVFTVIIVGLLILAKMRLG